MARSAPAPTPVRSIVSARWSRVSMLATAGRIGILAGKGPWPRSTISAPSSAATWLRPGSSRPSSFRNRNRRSVRRWELKPSLLPASSGAAISTRTRLAPTAGWSQRKYVVAIAKPATISCACPIISCRSTASPSRTQSRSAPIASRQFWAPRCMRRRIALARLGTFSPRACRRILNRPARRRQACSSPPAPVPPEHSLVSPTRSGRACRSMTGWR